MKKIVTNPSLFYQLSLVAIAVIFTSCSASNAENDGKKEKQAQLVEYKQQVHDLELKIAELEKELKTTDDVEYVDVILTELKPRLFEHYIDVTGSVEADQELNVSPEGSGQILSINVKEGQRVVKGTILATLNTEPIDRSIEQVKINLELAKTTFDRQKKLWDQHIGSELQYLQAKSTKEALEKQLENLIAQKDMSIIKAPVEGSIDVIYQKQGQIANPMTPFARLVNIEKVKVYADVAETYLTKIKQGDEVTISFPAIEKTINTKIQLIGNYIDPNNRTFRVRLDLQNSDKLIKPNMDAVVKIRDYVADNAIVVPSLLIKEDFRGNYTFIAEQKDNGLFAKKVYVTPGVSNNNITEIAKGLEEGTKVISEGFSQVFDGSAIKAN